MKFGINILARESSSDLREIGQRIEQANAPSRSTPLRQQPQQRRRAVYAATDDQPVQDRLLARYPTHRACFRITNRLSCSELAATTNGCATHSR